ncbi:acetyltransferase [Candidatus Magnetomorum sp. HK-1]|nr:acetyltransferase [Candidatus Magnetomorum sp. HK-1]
MAVYQIENWKPEIDSSVYIAPGAVVIGQVRIGKNASIWFNTVIRGDTDLITIGEETNIQDLSVCHADPGQPLTIGKKVTVGHRCVIHGCTIEDDCLIGMGAIVMNGARIGHGSIIAAGSVVLENSNIPPFSMVTGIPGRIKKTMDDDIIDIIHLPADVYTKRGQDYILKLKKL